MKTLCILSLLLLSACAASAPQEEPAHQYRLSVTARSVAPDQILVEASLAQEGGDVILEIWSRVVDEKSVDSCGDLDAVLEFDPLDDLSEELVSVEFPPLALGGLSELEDHREAGDSRAAALRPLRP